MEYEFRFVVKGATVDDADIVDLLANDFDAMLFLGGGVNLLDISYEGRDSFDAAISLAKQLAESVPRLKLVYLHRDLVGVPEIAERTGVTRQAVNLWIAGDRRNESTPFPLPEGISGRTKIWLWTEVNTWLAKYDLDDGIQRPGRMEMADIDSALHRNVYLRSPVSVERWRRTRAIGASAGYVNAAPLEASFEEDVAEDSPRGWQLQAQEELAGVQ